MSDKFISVTVESDAVMMVNLRQVQWFAFRQGEAPRMKLRHYDREFVIKENETAITHKLNSGSR